MVLIIASLSMLALAARPRGIPAWIWPVAGALVVVLAGYEPPAAAGTAILKQWNVLLFVLGLMGMAAAADESGAFDSITEFALRLARGSRRRLFVYVFLAAALLTVLFSNDATAIVLTPVVYRAVARRGGDAMPFLFACVFVADTASFGLPFSNPANVVILPHAALLPYLRHLGPPQLVAVAINLGLFLIVFRRELRGRYETADPSLPRAGSIRTLYALSLVALAYFVALAVALPLGPIAAAGALLTLAPARISLAAAARHVGWGTFALLGGLFVLFDAVARAGFVTWALHGLHDALGYGAAAASAVASASAAILSNVFNNLPVAVASSYVIERVPSPMLPYALIAGVDLGPNLTTTGSLATILWLAILHERGVRVRLSEYLRLGLIVVPATLGATLLWLWLIG